MANIIDTGIEIAGHPNLIRATLDRILERSVVIGDGATNERGYRAEDYISDTAGPATWFDAAELRQPQILNEWSDERHRVSISTESKWQAPWKLIHELIQAGLDVRAVWKDDDGYLGPHPDGDDLRNYGGFGEIRSYRNGEIFETPEQMFESSTDRPSYISIIEGDRSDPKLGFLEYRASQDEWLDYPMIARKDVLDDHVEEPSAEELDILEMGGTDAIIKATNIRLCAGICGSPHFRLLS